MGQVMNRITMAPTDTLLSNPNLSGASRYVVVSPVKDEAAFIDATIHSMIVQTICPVAWVIVNDGSRDETEAIVRKYAQEYPWIRLVNRQATAVRKRGRGVVEAFYAGFETIHEEYDFIVKLDGDLTFEPDYFEALLGEFNQDAQLGIAGGGLYEKPDGKSWVLYTVEDHVRGCTKIYRKSCFVAIGGLVPAMGWDGIDEWKALYAGWKIKSFLEQKIYHYRFTGAATGYIKSFIEQGGGAYRMGYHPIYMIARGIHCMGDRPYVIGGIAIIGAYFGAMIQRQEMLADTAVIHFIRQRQMKKLAGLIRSAF